MPFTPFHFGFGLALKGLARPVFSWSAFATTQVVIDCETLYYLLRHEYPVHRFFHSFLGAALAGLATAGLFLLLRRLIAKTSIMRSSALALSEICLPGIFLGALAGGLSHPFLDGIMHRDVQPLMPFTSHNPFLGLIGVGTLHLTCLLAAVLGVVVLSLRRTRNG